MDIVSHKATNTVLAALLGVMLLASPAAATLSIPARGARLVGGALQVEVSRDEVVEQLIRPTGLLDPEVELRSARHQGALHAESHRTSGLGGGEQFRDQRGRYASRRHSTPLSRDFVAIARPRWMPSLPHAARPWPS